MRTQWFVHSVLAAWAVGMIAVGSCLMLSHWVPLPHPEIDSRQLSKVLANSANNQIAGSWAAFHFLYAECPCSRRVLEHVIKQPPQPGVVEKIVLIGGQSEMEEAARQLGYEVDCVTAKELKSSYGVESAPLLVVVDPEGIPRYSGGYTSRKQGPDFQDKAIMKQLLAGKSVEQLPVYGCAVSRSLQSIVDPLGLKPKNNP